MFKGYVVISTVLFSSMVSASLFIMAKDFVSSWKKEWPFSVSCWFKLGFLSTLYFSFCSAAACSSDDTAGSCSFSEIRLDFLCRRLYHLCCKNGRKINFLCLTIFCLLIKKRQTLRKDNIMILRYTWLFVTFLRFLVSAIIFIGIEIRFQKVDKHGILNGV